MTRRKSPRRVPPQSIAALTLTALLAACGSDSNEPDADAAGSKGPGTTAPGPR